MTLSCIQLVDIDLDLATFCKVLPIADIEADSDIL